MESAGEPAEDAAKRNVYNNTEKGKTAFRRIISSGIFFTRVSVKLVYGARRVQMPFPPFPMAVTAASTYFYPHA
jgi:DNA-binding PadR family transcriptional regulator